MAIPQSRSALLDGLCDEPNLRAEQSQRRDTNFCDSYAIACTAYCEVMVPEHANEKNTRNLFLRNCRVLAENFAAIGSHLLSISPLSISSLTSLGLLPSTWHPTLNAVPRISFTPPFNSFERDLNLIVRAISITSSRVMDLECLMFFSFFRSRGGSLSALMTSDEADGTTETAA